MRKFSVIVPTFHSPDLITILIQTFEKFKPVDVENHFVVVENSDNESYKNSVMSLAENISWIQNPSAPDFTTGAGSIANGLGVVRGLEEIDDRFVFVAHCDVCVTSEEFFKELFKKRDEGYRLIGTSRDNTRASAVHISGLYVDIDLLKEVDIMPLYEGHYPNASMVLDVGDSLDVHCRENNLPVFCFSNTFNDESLIDSLSQPYKSFHVDRALDSDGNVMFMHLGRGVPKTFDVYNKPNRVYLSGWCQFYSEHLR